MSADGGFEFQKFQPRTNVRSTVNRMLREFLRETAPSASYKAIVADKGNGYWLSLVVYVQGNYFSSEAFWEKDRVRGRVRDWQVEEVARLLLDLRQQFRSFDRFRAATPAPLKK
ncbi:MAG: hypothetical protein NDI61_14735 [Bdellovibrionaceae bacterium]|nr:hypothetical protein [Pseudobdellovibrionaceae bacterium]